MFTSETHHADIPSLLHFAAQYGFKSVSSLLLQCPGAERALHTANRHGQTPTEIAKSHCHTELHVLLKETLVNTSSFCISQLIYSVFLFFSHVQSSFWLFQLPRSWIHLGNMIDNIILALLNTVKTFLKIPISDDCFSCSAICELTTQWLCKHIQSFLYVMSVA